LLAVQTELDEYTAAELELVVRDELLIGTLELLFGIELDEETAAELELCAELELLGSLELELTATDELLAAGTLDEEITPELELCSTNGGLTI